MFHLGHPEISARYNPVGSFSRITEVATRIAGQLPSEGQSAAFKEFVWRFVNVMARALVDVAITDSTLFEPKAAAPMLDRRRRDRHGMRTLGADKGYFNKSFVALLRARKVAPHIARIESRSAPGLDGRTTRHESYAISQRKRKRIEEIFGWMKVVGGLRKSRFVGSVKTPLVAYMVGAAYNLLRMARLQPNTG